MKAGKNEKEKDHVQRLYSHWSGVNRAKVQLHEGLEQAIFELGIWLGPFEAGCIKVSCPEKLAAVAAHSIHKGDRVAVVGAIGRYVYEPEKIKGPHELLFVARDLELVRKDSPVLGMTVSDENPKP